MSDVYRRRIEERKKYILRNERTLTNSLIVHLSFVPSQVITRYEQSFSQPTKTQKRRFLYSKNRTIRVICL